jgi:hypothetical protein
VADGDPVQQAYERLSQTFSAHAGDKLQFDARGWVQGMDAWVMCNISTSDWNQDIYISGESFYGYSVTLPENADYFIGLEVTALAVSSGQPGPPSAAMLDVDNVRVTAVPEPGALLLLGVGAAVLSAGYLKRKFW